MKQKTSITFRAIALRIAQVFFIIMSAGILADMIGCNKAGAAALVNISCIAIVIATQYMWETRKKGA